MLHAASQGVFQSHPDHTELYEPNCIYFSFSSDFVLASYNTCHFHRFIKLQLQADSEGIQYY